MTSIARCGSVHAPHYIFTINGVGCCHGCGMHFIDGVRQD
jgi:hypothetical protein